MKMRKVENAIILAAGMGSRMIPLTYEKPKGLIKVRGETMVERQIKQLLAVGIDKIIVVTGYLAEQFDFLQEKYAGQVSCIYNPEYEAKNNIASLYLVRQYLGDTYLLSADNYYTENIFRSEETERSWYCAVRSKAAKSEWGLVADESGRIIDVKKQAAAGQPYMYGAVFFSRERTKEFCRILEQEYENPVSHDWLWEELLIRHIQELEFYLHEESEQTVLELENLDDLRAFDPRYREDSGNPELEKIAQVFQVRQSEITDLQEQKLGLTNRSFLFRVRGGRYVFRLPGAGSSAFISRQNEYLVYEALKARDITDRIVYFDPDSGIKITVYEEDCHVLRWNSAPEAEIKKMLRTLKVVHESGARIDRIFYPKAEILGYEKKFREANFSFFADYAAIRDQLLCIAEYLETVDFSPVLCHIDFIEENVLVLKDGKIRLIDWEYAAMSDPMMDLAIFIISSGYDPEDLKKLAELYFDRSLSVKEEKKLYAYAAVCGLYWSLWAKYKEGQGYIFQEPYAAKVYGYVRIYINKLAETGFFAGKEDER